MKQNISFPDGIVQAIDNFVRETKKYSHRSHFIVEACREKLQRENNITN